jgi:hypothetical protein
MLLQQCHQTYLLLDAREPVRTRALEARARRWAIVRRRLRDLLRAPAGRFPAGVQHG